MSKSLCSRCHTVQPYNEIKVPIKYGFNDKDHVLIDGIERVCAVCGYHVDDIEVSRINHDIAKEALESGKGYTVAPSIDRRGIEDEADENDDNAAGVEYEDSTQIETDEMAAGEKIA